MSYVEHYEIRNGEADADEPDEDQDQLGLELGVLALERRHDAAVPVQRDHHQRVDAGVDAHVLKQRDKSILGSVNKAQSDVSTTLDGSTYSG